MGQARAELVVFFWPDDPARAAGGGRCDGTDCHCMVILGRILFGLKYIMKLRKVKSHQVTVIVPTAAHCGVTSSLHTMRYIGDEEHRHR